MFVVYLRGGSETEPNNGVIEVIVPKEPNDELEVVINKPDGTLDRVYRFSKECVISIKELE